MTRASLAAMLLAVSGCAATQPYQRPYVWTPTGASAANLAAMADDPADLARGRGVGGTDSAVAAGAVDRLLKGHVKSLSDSSTTGSSSSSGSGAASQTN